MTNEVVRTRRPAEVIRAEALPKEEIMVGTRTDLRKRIARGKRRGEYAGVGPLYPIGRNEYGVYIHRIKEEPPRWRKPAIIAGCVLSFLALAVVGFALAIRELLAVTAGITMGSLIGFLVVLVIAGVIVKNMFRGPRVSVKVDVR